ncbi:MAG: NUDIX domain-containing protein [Roseitalea sp.]|jgi:8-oxo-dGTP pyrophosphatase MutT (NUDIX family)|nr:NUDIX domain-containing protein [Roseitalea sp.]MBO6723226.1 NUDIX domain-containing protein [Roseitalea sp.]MBO6741796.1 NUDIX domain-containing protein [Roseitalea sp.]
MSLRTRLFHLFFVLTRPVTLGARAMVIDADDRVLLVRHTYAPGWHLPGGGVEPGETALDCAIREVREEGNVVVDGEMVLHGLFHNDGASRRDHVAVYVCRTIARHAPKRPDREIAAAGFFALDGLPDGTTPATRRRLEEWQSGSAPATRW